MFVGATPYRPIGQLSHSIQSWYRYRWKCRPRELRPSPGHVWDGRPDWRKCISGSDRQRTRLWSHLDRDNNMDHRHRAQASTSLPEPLSITTGWLTITSKSMAKVLIESEIEIIWFKNDCKLIENRFSQTLPLFWLLWRQVSHQKFYCFEPSLNNFNLI